MNNFGILAVHVIYYYFVLNLTFYESRMADIWQRYTILLLCYIKIYTNKTKLCLRMKHTIIVFIGS